MHHEPWQVFAENGEPIIGVAYQKADFPKDAIMGAAQIWLWRRSVSGVEIMLQKRAQTLSSWPGYFDISVTGHIDVGELPIQSAVRESSEEIGLEVEPALLKFIFTFRTPLCEFEIDYVYLYEADDSFEPKFDDGEVELVKWLTLGEFEQQTKAPEKYNLLNQGEHYFGLLIDQLRRL